MYRSISGWINLYKPTVITSNDTLTKVKIFQKTLKFPKIKIGHAGTLDSLACGILPIALGEATKTIPYIMDAKKTYIFDITWGKETDTLDNDGKIIKESNIIPSLIEIQNILKSFLGKIEQVPPLYSALKINGKRSSDLAREGIEVELKPREIEIFNLKVIEHFSHATRFSVQCSKGTYVRSLARDIAYALNTVGFITYLERTQVGPFTKENAIPLEKLLKFDYTSYVSSIVPIRFALDDIPALSCNTYQVQHLVKGQRVEVFQHSFHAHQHILCLDLQNNEIGIAEYNDGYIYPKRIFNLSF